jgi:hypothetical protein
VRITIILLALVFAACCTGCATNDFNQSNAGQAPVGAGTAADSLFALPEGVETRWASAENFKGEKGKAGQTNSGRKGSANFKFTAGETRVLAEVAGRSGTVRRIWITISDRSPRMLRGIRLDMYWDGAAKPAVSVPLGDFFGQGLGQMVTFDSAFFSSPEGRSFNCLVPMPFKTGMKIVVTNESGKDLAMFFYDVDYTLGDKHPADVPYFHAFFHRENPTQLRRDFEILPRIDGRGRYLGALISVIPDKARYQGAWWGEGEVKVFLDGDQDYPTLCGTGTEDYIGTGWGMKVYANLYQGCLLSDKPKSMFSFYRWHVPDPVYFHKDIRVTMQQIGYCGADKLTKMVEDGQTIHLASKHTNKTIKTVADIPADGGLFERQDDWSSCAYFYLDRPASDLPPLEAVDARIAGLEPKATQPAK